MPRGLGGQAGQGSIGEGAGLGTQAKHGGIHTVRSRQQPQRAGFGAETGLRQIRGLCRRQPTKKCRQTGGPDGHNRQGGIVGGGKATQFAIVQL